MSDTKPQHYNLNDYTNHFKDLNEEDIEYLTFLKHKETQKKHWVKE